MEINLNLIFFLLSVFLGIIALFSGAWIIVRSFFGFRTEITRSMNMDLEIIRVSKTYAPKEEAVKADAWKDEIGAMEQFLSTLSAMKEKKGIWHRFLYGDPYVSFEIANSAKSDEIVFFVSIPKKFKESVEKQIHSFFPNASLEESKDFNIFYPGSHTEAAVLKLKNKYILPIKTYENMEVDPLSAISNAISKLDLAEEGAAYQLILKPTAKTWRMKGRTAAQRMQQGKRLKDIHSNSYAGKVGKEMGNILYEAMKSPKKTGQPDAFQPKPVQLTPEEQELVKSLEQKSSKAGFEVNIRFVASAATAERAQQILAQMENAFVDQNVFFFLKNVFHLR